MVNNGKADIVPMSCKDRIVGECKFLYCIRCKKTYEISDNEICLNNPNRYYRTCYDCRKKICNNIRNGKNLCNKPDIRSGC